MTWTEIARQSLRAAARLKDDEPRSAVSRAYYATHAVLTDALTRAGYVPSDGRQTPPHDAQPRLIRVHMAGLGQQKLRELSTVVRRLKQSRIDADYNRRQTVDIVTARQAIRDAHRVFTLLEVSP